MLMLDKTKTYKKKVHAKGKRGDPLVRIASKVIILVGHAEIGEEVKFNVTRELPLYAFGKIIWLKKIILDLIAQMVW